MNPYESPLVTVIVPTMASKERAEQLMNAVRSVISDPSAPRARVLVCANGPRIEPVILARLRELQGVVVVVLPQPSLTQAIAHGRRLVDTEFFCYLDDDDTLLPGGLARRLAMLSDDSALDLAVTNGIRRNCGLETPMLPHGFQVISDPLAALFQQNWLASCGGLFRSATIGTKYFDNCHDYAEWTWIAYNLAIDGRKVGYIEEPGFVINDTEGSRSKTAAYRASYLALYEGMLARNPPHPIKAKVQMRLAAALHDMSDESLQAGRILQALRLHLRSLTTPGGMRYASYTRHLIGALLFRPARRD